MQLNTRPQGGILSRPVFLSLLLYCLLGTVLVVMESASIIPSPVDTTYPEAATAYVALLAGRTGHLYRSYLSPPYVVQPYGPLFYAVNAMFARVTHLELSGTMRLGRLLAFGCYLLCGLVVFAIGRRLDFSKLESALAALMLFAQPAFLGWNATMRPDLMALLGMLLCLFFVVGQEPANPKSCFLSGLSAGIALLFKQSAFVAPAAIAIVFLLSRKYRETVALAAASALPVLIVIGALSLHRGSFLQQFTAAGQSIWSIAAGARWMITSQPLAMLPVPLIIGAVGFVEAVKGNEQSKMIASFALITLFGGMATIPQIGGDLNYFLPALAGCALLLPFAMRTVARHARTSKVAIGLAVCVLLAGTVGGAIVCRLYDSRAERGHITYDALQPYHLISDDPHLAVQGRDPELLDPYTAHVFELAGRWNPSEVVEKIHRGDYDLVILRSNRPIQAYRGVSFFGAPIVDAINANYKTLCAADSALVLVPKERPVSVTPEIFRSILGPCIPSIADPSPNLFIDSGAR